MKYFFIIIIFIMCFSCFTTDDFQIGDIVLFYGTSKLSYIECEVIAKTDSHIKLRILNTYNKEKKPKIENEFWVWFYDESIQIQKISFEKPDLRRK